MQPRSCTPRLAEHGERAKVLHLLALHTLGQLEIRCTLVLHPPDWMGMEVQLGSCTHFPGSCTHKVVGHEGTAQVLHFS